MVMVDVQEGRVSLPGLRKEAGQEEGEIGSVEASTARRRVMLLYAGGSIADLQTMMFYLLDAEPRHPHRDPGASARSRDCGCRRKPAARSERRNQTRTEGNIAA